MVDKGEEMLWLVNLGVSMQDGYILFVMWQLRAHANPQTLVSTGSWVSVGLNGIKYSVFPFRWLMQGQDPVWRQHWNQRKWKLCLETGWKATRSVNCRRSLNATVSLVFYFWLVYSMCESISCLLSNKYWGGPLPVFESWPLEGTFDLVNMFLFLWTMTLILIS